MSDCKDIYRKVREFMKNFYPGEPSGNLARNLNTLAVMITGLLVGKETQLPKIALNVPDPIAAPNVEKRIKRLIINESVTEETFFFPFIRTLLLLKLDLEELVVAVDGIVAGRGCICLMASLIYKNRALPLAFTVFKGKKGHLPEEAHIELVRKLKSVIPYKPKNVVLLGDGEFDGVELQKTLARRGWKYVCRTARNTIVGVGEEEFSMDVLASMLPESHFKKLKNCTVTKKKYGPVTAIAWLAEDCEEPLFLVAISYRRRWRANTTKNDSRSRPFSATRKAGALASTKATCPNRYAWRGFCSEPAWPTCGPFFWDFWRRRPAMRSLYTGRAATILACFSSG